MTDDAAFIAAIRAAPSDDAARLVYADWLEERGESARAEYLRLVHALATLPDDAKGRRKLVRRLQSVVRATDETWRDVVGRRFDVVIEGQLGQLATMVFKLVGWLLGGDRPPFEPGTGSVRFKSGVRREEAEATLDQVDPKRFRKDRSGPLAWRIVPAGTPLALPNAG